MTDLDYNGFCYKKLTQYAKNQDTGSRYNQGT